MVLYLFLLPFGLINGPGVADITDALVAFGRQLDDGAAEFQGIVLGVLGALFIGRIVAPVDDVKHEVEIDVGSAFAGHVLAAFVVSTALLTGVGVAGDDETAGHVWYFSLLAIVAYALAWGIDAGITITRKRQRRRARAALVGTSWRVHRRAARLVHVRGARVRPGVRLLVVISSTVVVAAAAAAYLVIVTAPGGVSGLFVIAVVGSAVVLATWGTIWASFLLLAIEPGGTWVTVAAAWAMSAVTTAGPVVAVMLMPTDSAIAPVKVGIVLAVMLPFLHLAAPVRFRFLLRGALVAVELRWHRVRRLVLLRDWYALRKRRSDRPDADGQDAQLLAFLLRAGASAPRKLPKTASLANHRPSHGIGSEDWWEQHRQPAMFSPLHPERQWWTRR